ncbi:MAG: UDP-N-acetylmuramoyl-L-alanine--D-glutamate ligase [Spirochaetes bacterium]|nr:UDP-N-acetylmuramoyl-L-alanine--D-glutamate ligase [Spirochaetota bacterium]
MCLKNTLEHIRGMKVTVMGLGLNGGGIEAARFFAKRGAQVTVTDLRSEEVLKPSIEILKDFSIRYVLGKHDPLDFESADLVVKNPAVRPDSPFLRMAKRVETDISLFLTFFSGPILAVTGSKGKSTTASALHYGLQGVYPLARLGGNITVSPLSFLEDLDPKTPVVLELSSWQLADLPNPRILKPKVAIITCILPDHQDRYPNMETYVRDKEIIYRSQTKEDATLLHYDDPYGKRFFSTTPGTPYAVSSAPLPEGLWGAYLDEGKGFAVLPGTREEVVPEKVTILGKHQKKNLLYAGLALRLLGVPAEIIRTRLADFPGVEHRLEYCGEIDGIRFYNDSAATIPEATVCGIESFDTPLRLITGGTDKNLDFRPLIPSIRKTKGIYLLAGTGSDKLKVLLEEAGIRYNGPYPSLEMAVWDAFEQANPSETILFSPGCTSFGMFLNEFDRGRKYKEIVSSLKVRKAD